MSSHRLAVRPLAVALAALALASPTAMAAPIDSLSEEQVLASRGTGAPSEPAAAVSDSPRAEAPDSGFDWGSAAIGAAALAALLAAGTLVAMALDRRSRVRTAS